MLSPYFYIVGQDPRCDRDRAEKIAILGLEVVGPVDLESVRVARELTDALRSRAAAGPYAIAPNSNRELIDEKLMHRCDDERPACMAKIGRALSADHLLYGKIGRKSQGAASTGYEISLRLLDINSGHVRSWTNFVPSSSGARLSEWGRAGYEHLIAAVHPPDRRPAADGVLISATNETFWQLTQYKRGQKLDMSDPQDRAMSKTWLDIYAQIKGHRERATSLATRVLNETVTPYVLVIEQGNGSLTHRTFERRSNLDVQYNWLVDQPEYYTYLAMFDFTQNRDAPIRDQFAMSKRQQRLATSGWYGC